MEEPSKEKWSVEARSLHVGSFPQQQQQQHPPSWSPQIDSRRPLQHMVSSSLTTTTTSSSSTKDDENDNNDEEDLCSLKQNDAWRILLQERIRDAWKQQPEKEEEYQQQQQEEEVLDDLLLDTPQLERIWVARKENLEAATTLALEQVRFRARWKPAEIGSHEISTALESGAWRLCGYSREGCVVSNYKLHCWDPSAYTKKGSSAEAIDEAVNEYTRYVVYMMEQQISHMKPGVPQTFVVIFDLKGFTPSLIFRRNVRLMIRKLIYVAQAQYPERLRKTLLVNAPFGFEAAWKLIHPLLDPETASKISFCQLTDLLEEIDPEVLSVEYGGMHPQYPAFTVWDN